MKKLKLSNAERRLGIFLVMCVLIEILTILLVLDAISGLAPLKIQDTKQIDIVVEDVYYDYGRTSSRLVLVSGTEKYFVHNRSSGSEYSIRQLREMIDIGDNISLNYCEERNVWGRYNSVISAQTETEVYRSISDFNKDKKTGSTILIIVLAIFELIFSLIVVLSTWLNKNIIKSLFRKLRKTRKTGSTRGRGQGDGLREPF